MANVAQKVPYQSKIPFFRGTGRRKSSVARVRIMVGKGSITINDRDLLVYFTEVKDRGQVMGPLLATDLANRLDVIVSVHGGGTTGQAGAVSQGLARAIKIMFAPPPETEKAPAPTTAEPATVDGAPVEAKPEAKVEEVSTEAGIARKLRESGYLTRDRRMRERKKYGRKGARKSFQFSKR